MFFYVLQCFCIFTYVIFINVSSDSNMSSLVAYADIGPVRPPGSSPLHRRGEGPAAGVGAEAVEENLEALMERIQGMSFDEVPLHLQRYTVGVSQRVRRLLQRVV